MPLLSESGIAVSEFFAVRGDALCVEPVEGFQDGLPVVYSDGVFLAVEFQLCRNVFLQSPP